MTESTDRAALEAHLRDAHPNLLGEGHRSRVSRSPLPRDLASVSYGWLLAVHDANHELLFRNHQDDDWLAPKAAKAAGREVVASPTGSPRCRTPQAT